MRVGLFADCHDHLDNVRRAVDEFNRRECDVVLFAGDLVSTFAVPPLRQLRCPFVGCFGDNEGNRVGLRSGMRIIGRLEEAPVRYQSPDGVRLSSCTCCRKRADSTSRSTCWCTATRTGRPCAATPPAAAGQPGRDQRLDVWSPDDRGARLAFAGSRADRLAAPSERPAERGHRDRLTCVSGIRLRGLARMAGRPRSIHNPAALRK